MGMVVRSNIMAINANRQLGANNNQVSKSLEKLSSGFKINRAGDDAAGLAISEKMKAQIKGLEQASANSQDGISLVQTAEGALTEVHSMLNRMVELATKSANGTIQDKVDREAIQSEIDALITEVDRIGDSTNFNGINLLDGSLGGGSAKLTDADIAVGKSLGTAGLTGGTAADDKLIVTKWDGINGGSGEYTIATGTIDTNGVLAPGTDTADRDIVVTRTDADGNQQNFVLKLDDIMTVVDKDGKLKEGTDANTIADGDKIYLDLSAAGLGKIEMNGVDVAADMDILGALNDATAEITDSAGAGGLTLQVGDTGDQFNMVTVSVDDMRATSLGLKGLDVSTADSARAAIDTIKSAINMVSTNRANLGALQNRLEYTINNLDVAAENMTAANSRIRDTDMAKQMMEYTKTNVLTQAAQAMLAQANQQPQSILQLLQ